MSIANQHTTWLMTKAGLTLWITKIRQLIEGYVFVFVSVFVESFWIPWCRKQWVSCQMRSLGVSCEIPYDLLYQWNSKVIFFCFCLRGILLDSMMPETVGFLSDAFTRCFMEIPYDLLYQWNSKVIFFVFVFVESFWIPWCRKQWVSCQMRSLGVSCEIP